MEIRKIHAAREHGRNQGRGTLLVKKIVNPQEIAKSDVVLRGVAHWSFSRVIRCIYKSSIKIVALIPDYWCQIVHNGNFRLGFFRIPRL